MCGLVTCVLVCVCAVWSLLCWCVFGLVTGVFVCACWFGNWCVDVCVLLTGVLVCVWVGNLCIGVCVRVGNCCVCVCVGW